MVTLAVIGATGAAVFSAMGVESAGTRRNAQVARGAEFDRGAPARLIRAASERSNRSPSRVNHPVLSNLAGTLQCNVCFKDGAFATGDRHKRLLRQVGQPRARP